MKPNKFSERARALKRADIAAVEKKLGFALPTDLTKHYLAQNGGTPLRKLFHSAAGHEASVDLFLPMRFESYEDETLLEDNYLELVAKGKRLPAHLIPFAEDEGGDPYCIDRRDQKIYYFAMGHEDDPKRATRFVADSLAAFVEGMQTPREFYAKEVTTKRSAANEVLESLSTIEQFLASKLPDSRKALRKPIAAPELARVRKLLGVQPELETLYGWHDGMKDHEEFVNGGMLLSAKGAREIYKVHVEELEEDEQPAARKRKNPAIRSDTRWRKKWWPLTDADGDHIVLDLDPGPKGVVGQVITFDNSDSRPQIVIADSITDWLARYAAAITSGKLKVKDGLAWVDAFQG